MARRGFVVSLSLLGAAVALAGAAGCSLVPGLRPATPAARSATSAKASPFTEGQKVAALWSDGNYYLATVSSVDGAEVTVVYSDDSSTKVVKVSDLLPVPKKRWTVGDKVLAVWSTGRFYEGEITSADPPRYTVKWSDGTTPSQVTADKIIAIPPKAP